MKIFSKSFHFKNIYLKKYRILANVIAIALGNGTKALKTKHKKKYILYLPCNVRKSLGKYAF